MHFTSSALKKMNEKKQVFNNYKTQRSKEEKVKDGEGEVREGRRRGKRRGRRKREEGGEKEEE